MLGIDRKIRRGHDPKLRLALGLGVWGLVFSLGLGGCGYSQGPLVREGMRVVAVPIFENNTYFRELEFSLTNEVVRQIHARPDISVSSPDRADIILEGRIMKLQQAALSEDERDRLRESSATTTVRVRLRDAKSGAIIKEYNVRDRADFVVASGESLLTAQEESFVDLARRIIYGLETGF